MVHGFLNGMASWDLIFCFLLSVLFGSTIAESLAHYEYEPEFLAPLENHTVIQGRDVFFTCVVNHLQAYKVAWIKADSRAILAMHTHMVAPNPRLSVTHNGHNTWKLHVIDVQPDDSGAYMCQVNTEPMRSQIGHMKVVTPPDILDETSDRLESIEKGVVHLKCRATGNPVPEITWRREDGRSIVLRHSNTSAVAVKTYKSEVLHLEGVLRQEMGFYLCIASNGVPPSVSKRYYVNVLFKPTVATKHQIIYSQLNDHVILQCFIESPPKSLITWYVGNGNIHNSVQVVLDERRVISEIALNDFTYHVNLTIKKLQYTDFGTYMCSAENSLGKTIAAVRLRENRMSRNNASTSRHHKKLQSHNSLDSEFDKQKLNDFGDRYGTSKYIDDEFSNFPASPGAHYDSADFSNSYDEGAAMKNHVTRTFLTFFTISTIFL